MTYALLIDPPNIEDSARHLADHACRKNRERIKARARAMRAQLGLPESEALR